MGSACEPLRAGGRGPVEGCRAAAARWPGRRPGPGTACGPRAVAPAVVGHRPPPGYSTWRSRSPGGVHLAGTNVLTATFCVGGRETPESPVGTPGELLTDCLLYTSDAADEED